MNELMQGSDVARDVEGAVRDVQRALQDAQRAAQEAQLGQLEGLRGVRQERGPDGSRVIIIPKANGEETRIVVGVDGALQETRLGTAQTPPAAPAPRRKELPGGLVEMMAVIFGFVALTSIGTPIAKAWARRYERKGEREQQVQLAQRLDAIEQAIETVAVEVERISEGQRFTSKLLAERAASEAERVR